MCLTLATTIFITNHMSNTCHHYLQMGAVKRERSPCHNHLHQQPCQQHPLCTGHWLPGWICQPGDALLHIWLHVLCLGPGLGPPCPRQPLGRPRDLREGAEPPWGWDRGRRGQACPQGHPIPQDDVLPRRLGHGDCQHRLHAGLLPDCHPDTSAPRQVGRVVPVAIVLKMFWIKQWHTPH